MEMIRDMLNSCIYHPSDAFVSVECAVPPSLREQERVLHPSDFGTKALHFQYGLMRRHQSNHKGEGVPEHVKDARQTVLYRYRYLRRTRISHTLGVYLPQPDCRSYLLRARSRSCPHPILRSWSFS